MKRRKEKLAEEEHTRVCEAQYMKGAMGRGEKERA